MTVMPEALEQVTNLLRSPTTSVYVVPVCALNCNWSLRSAVPEVTPPVKPESLPVVTPVMSPDEPMETHAVPL